MINAPLSLTAVILGQSDFCRQLETVMRKQPGCQNIITGNIIDAWSLIIGNRPNLLIIEAGYSYNFEMHEILLSTLRQVKERFPEIYTAICAPSPEKFSYVGDLLFEGKEGMKGSELIDTLIFNPPPNIVEYSSITEEICNLLTFIELELNKRIETKKALPKLNNDEWIQSQADPRSRELWMRWIPRYASYTNESPLIIGETGTGKTKVAYALHKLSERKGNFVSITPRDFSSSELVQAELFGAVAGAYTGAVDKWGLVKSAEKGTLFIDELQSIDKDLQGKLITFIENKTYRRVGSAESIEADVRFIFASNRSIEDMITSNILREDFAYRLERVQLKLPPLRDRRMDIPAALSYALSKIHRQRMNSRKILGYSGGAYRILFCYAWPGNLRQLENLVAQACDLAEIENKTLIDDKHIIEILGSKTTLNSVTASQVIAHAAGEVLEQALLNNITGIEESAELFAEQIRLKALEASMGDPKKAAELISDNENIIGFTAQNKISKKTTRMLQ
jgi:transcriptional regulator with PAS, ATPase and Fis domain